LRLIVVSEIELFIDYINAKPLKLPQDTTIGEVITTVSQVVKYDKASPPHIVFSKDWRYPPEDERHNLREKKFFLQV
jgi:nicotinamidase-related amidase